MESSHRDAHRFPNTPRVGNIDKSDALIKIEEQSKLKMVALAASREDARRKEAQRLIGLQYRKAAAERQQQASTPRRTGNERHNEAPTPRRRGEYEEDVSPAGHHPVVNRRLSSGRTSEYVIPSVPQTPYSYDTFTGTSSEAATTRVGSGVDGAVYHQHHLHHRNEDWEDGSRSPMAVDPYAIEEGAEPQQYTMQPSSHRPYSLPRPSAVYAGNQNTAFERTDTSGLSRAAATSGEQHESVDVSRITAASETMGDSSFFTSGISMAKDDGLRTTTSNTVKQSAIEGATSASRNTNSSVEESSESLLAEARVIYKNFSKMTKKEKFRWLESQRLGSSLAATPGQEQDPHERSHLSSTMAPPNSDGGNELESLIHPIDVLRHRATTPNASSRARTHSAAQRERERLEREAAIANLAQYAPTERHMHWARERTTATITVARSHSSAAKVDQRSAVHYAHDAAMSMSNQEHLQTDSESRAELKSATTTEGNNVATADPLEVMSDDDPPPNPELEDAKRRMLLKHAPTSDLFHGNDGVYRTPQWQIDQKRQQKAKELERQQRALEDEKRRRELSEGAFEAWKRAHPILPKSTQNGTEGDDADRHASNHIWDVSTRAASPPSDEHIRGLSPPRHLPSHFANEDISHQSIARSSRSPTRSVHVLPNEDKSISTHAPHAPTNTNHSPAAGSSVATVRQLNEYLLALLEGCRGADSSNGLMGKGSSSSNNAIIYPLPDLSLRSVVKRAALSTPTRGGARAPAPAATVKRLKGGGESDTPRMNAAPRDDEGQQSSSQPQSSPHAYQVHLHYSIRFLLTEIRKALLDLGLKALKTDYTLDELKAFIAQPVSFDRKGPHDDCGTDSILAHRAVGDSGVDSSFVVGGGSRPLVTPAKALFPDATSQAMCIRYVTSYDTTKALSAATHSGYQLDASSTTTTNKDRGDEDYAIFLSMCEHSRDPQYVADRRERERWSTLRAAMGQTAFYPLLVDDPEEPSSTSSARAQPKSGPPKGAFFLVERRLAMLVLAKLAKDRYLVGPSNRLEENINLRLAQATAGQGLVKGGNRFVMNASSHQTIVAERLVDDRPNSFGIKVPLNASEIYSGRSSPRSVPLGPRLRSVIVAAALSAPKSTSTATPETHHPQVEEDGGDTISHDAPATNDAENITIALVEYYVPLLAALYAPRHDGTIRPRSNEDANSMLTETMEGSNEADKKSLPLFARFLALCVSIRNLLLGTDDAGLPSSLPHCPFFANDLAVRRAASAAGLRPYPIGGKPWIFESLLALDLDRGVLPNEGVHPNVALAILEGVYIPLVASLLLETDGDFCFDEDSEAEL